MEYESDSDCVSMSDSQSLSGDLYTLEDINSFLDETFGQSVKVMDYFSDPEKFLKCALTLQKGGGVDIFNEGKHFCL